MGIVLLVRAYGNGTGMVRSGNAIIHLKSQQMAAPHGPSCKFAASVFNLLANSVQKLGLNGTRKPTTREAYIFLHEFFRLPLGQEIFGMYSSPWDDFRMLFPPLIRSYSPPFSRVSPAPPAPESCVAAGQTVQ